MSWRDDTEDDPIGADPNEPMLGLAVATLGCVVIPAFALVGLFDRHSGPLATLSLSVPLSALLAVCGGGIGLVELMRHRRARARSFRAPLAAVLLGGAVLLGFCVLLVAASLLFVH